MWSKSILLPEIGHDPRRSPDLHLFVRKETDIPITMKGEVMEYLKEVGWKPRKAIGEPSRLVPEEEV